MSFLVTIGADNKSEVVVSADEAPETLEPNQYFVEDADIPEGSGSGRWIKVGKTVRPMTDAEREAEIAERAVVNAADQNRRVRDFKLSQTDWVVIKAAEAGVEVDAGVAAYRQALRDITTHAKWPMLEESDWPSMA
jgi:hypothetical protein